MNNISETTFAKLNLFYRLLRVRMIEEAIAKSYRNKEMRCPVHFSVGQEAIPVGICETLRQKDYVVGTHRSHAIYLAKGGSMGALIAELMGKSSGCCKGRSGSQHLCDLNSGFIASSAILGGNFPIGVGIAFASKYRNEDRTTAIFFGDASTEEGSWCECLNFAALKNLQVLFVCENNFLSVCSPMKDRQAPKRDRIAIAQAHGIWAKKGYGNDVEEVYQIANEAVSFIKENKQPAFIEFDTYRFWEHCGPSPDYHLNYRSLEEINLWLNNCPLKVFERKNSELLKNFDSQINLEKRQIEDEIEEAFSFARSSSLPNI